jgi:hypothetical protein
MRTKSCGSLVWLFAGVACAATVPVPKVQLLPVTADSYPFSANSRTLGPMDLAKSGYVEEEFLVTGTANVYDWAEDGSLNVKTPNAPYGTRILVRRPGNLSRFSGTAIVEIPNTARRFDWSMMWGYLRDQIVEQGHAWVLVTTPAAVQALKKFNPTRYAGVSFADPNAGGACPGAGKNGPSDQEDGLRWDAFSQIAAALKNGLPGGFKAQYTYMTVQGSDTVTYVNAIHSRAALASGKPAYDGYLMKNAAPANRISQCAPPPPRGDARQAIARVNVPVINVVAQGEALDSLAMRKPDSDDPDGRFRLYEIAGATHLDRNGYTGMPIFADQTAAVGAAQGTPEWPFNVTCDPPITLSTHQLLKYAFSGALANLDAWVKKGTVPPKADRIGVKDAGTPQAALIMDEYLAGVGGVRNPYVDAPIASYYTKSAGPGTCREMGYTVPFDTAKIQSIHGDQKRYAAKVTQSIDHGVRERFFTESDGKRLKTELLATPAATGAHK